MNKPRFTLHAADGAVLYGAATMAGAYTAMERHVDPSRPVAYMHNSNPVVPYPYVAFEHLNTGRMGHSCATMRDVRAALAEFERRKVDEGGGHWLDKHIVEQSAYHAKAFGVHSNAMADLQQQAEQNGW